MTDRHDRNERNEIVPTAPSGLTRQGSNLVRRGLDDLSKLGGTDANPQAWPKHGTELYKLGRYDEAVACFDKVLELHPGAIEAWWWKGAALFALDRFEESMVCFDRVIEMDPHDFTAWSRQAFNLESLGRPNDSLHCYHRALELSPDNGQIWYGQGRVLYRLGRLDDAMRSYDNGIERQPTYAPVWTGKGAVLLNWDRFSEALVYFERARVLDADNPEPWYFRALAEEGLGRERDAVNSLRKFLDLAPRKPKLEQAMIDDAHRRLQKLRVRDTGP